jgi:hypothetical protein
VLLDVFDLMMQPLLPTLYLLDRTFRKATLPLPEALNLARKVVLEAVLERKILTSCCVLEGDTPRTVAVSLADANGASIVTA